MRFEAPDLPILDIVEPLRGALAENSDAIVVAPPGAGKTTLIPLLLADERWLSGRRIVMLEPRRLATRAAARRIAALLGESVGQRVGYQTRDERHIGPSTRIEVVTEGVLTRRLQHDATLDGVGLVIFDEIHERNLPTDLGLALALDARTQLGLDLRVLAMSATPDVAGLQRVLGADTPVLTSAGRMYPVETVWSPVGKHDRVVESCTALVQRAVREQHGSVLVFLPGIGEIRRVQSLLTGSLPDDVDVFALAGALSSAEQDAALQPSAAGRRRVVLSTDIAESSLTVDGVRVVVDCGLARVPRFDARTGMSRLTTVSTSRASADQRSGRAGRVEPGVAYRMWSKLEHTTRRAHLEPEITQVDLAGLALELAAWGSAPAALRWIDPPPPKVFTQGADLLGMLGALDPSGAPTATGRRMLSLPLHPRLAHMVVACRDNDRGLACVLGALLDDRDVFRGRPDELPADVAPRIEVVCGMGHDRADRRDVDRVRQRARDLATRAGGTLDLDGVRAERSGAVLALGYPDRIGVRRSQPGQWRLRNGSGAWTPANDSLATERFVVAADLDGKRDNARIRLAAAIDTAEVVDVLAEQIEQRRTIAWDDDRDDLVERTELRLGGMVLDIRTRPAPLGDETTAFLLSRVVASRLDLLSWTDEARTLQHRMAFVRARLGAEWPDWSDDELVRTATEWLGPYLAFASGRGDVERLDVAMLLSAQLGWDTAQQFAELVPTHLTTAAGTSVTIDWSRERPTARVRVQDLFGTRVHPTVLGGRIPLTLELLSPADRPLQVTADLPGFWAGSWAEVRKEMAGRYPKHQWPVDPANAPPHRLK